LPSEVLAARLKVRFLRPDVIADFPTALQALLLGKRSSEWSAATFAVNSYHVVIENTTHSENRREATRMHEMAHLICGHRPTGFHEGEGVGVLLRGHDQEQEDEADWLGRCLQLPKPVLGWCLNRDYTPEQISAHCRASLDLVRLRLNLSGVLLIRQRMKRD
jgi:Zn-dependent peptidase ImmA (M78 family)